MVLEDDTWNAILTHHREVEKAAKPRLLEEVYRLFPYQTGESAFRLLRKTRLLRILFPEVDGYLDRHGDADSLVWNCLGAIYTDVGEQNVPTPPLIFGALIYPLVMERIREAAKSGARVSYAQIAHEVLKPVALRFQMPKRVFFDVVHIFGDQQRLDEWVHSPEKVRRIMGRPWFENSLALREIYLIASGGELDPVHVWRDMYKEFAHTRPPQPPREHARRSGRRPFFRRRRRHPGGAQHHSPPPQA